MAQTELRELQELLHQLQERAFASEKPLYVPVLDWVEARLYGKEGK